MINVCSRKKLTYRKASYYDTVYVIHVQFRDMFLLLLFLLHGPCSCSSTLIKTQVHVHRFSLAVLTLLNYKSKVNKITYTQILDQFIDDNVCVWFVTCVQLATYDHGLNKGLKCHLLTRWKSQFLNQISELLFQVIGFLDLLVSQVSVKSILGIASSYSKYKNNTLKYRQSCAMVRASDM